MNGQATAVDTSTQLLSLFFHTAAEDEVERKCGWAQERTGMEGWRSKGNRDGGNRNCFCFDLAYTF